MNYTPYSLAELNARLLSTEAVSIWNANTGPVFWYAANVPGPFYVNTERLIGRDAAQRLLASLSEIVQTTAPAPEKAARIRETVLAEYHSNPEYQRIVANLRALLREEDPTERYVISGGERRDWFFSVPLAYETNAPHVFLFKDGSIFIDSPSSDTPSKVTEVIHVADLINNAASYIDHWIPFLKNHGITIRSTAAVISRGEAGLEALKRSGVPVRTVVSIRRKFFEELCAQGLIREEQLAELKIYFSSQAEWARSYIVSNPVVLRESELDQKSRTRLDTFLREDPWGLWMGRGTT